MNRLYYSLFLFFSFTANTVRAQPGSMVEVKGIPTKEIYDLMIDSRGFLWAGHNLGLSRFDGVSFTHFSNPMQKSYALGDILEDPSGRIWCRNFSCQIFYVENEKMHLLESYDSKNEPRFPRMVMIGNKLVATSKKGLFVYNTNSLASSYISCEGKTISSISVINNEIIAFGEGKCFRYDPNGDGRVIPLTNDNSLQMRGDFIAQPYGYKDTVYSFSSHTGNITKLLVTNNNITIAGIITAGGFKNTINPSGMDTWIHARERSVTLDGTKRIDGYDLTDLVMDKEGNTWYSSFKYGLMVSYKNYWEKIKIPGIDDKDIVTNMDRGNNVILYGTSTGKLILENAITEKIIRSFQLPSNGGRIDYIKAIDPSRFIISTSLAIYMLEDDLTNLEIISSSLTLKNAVRGDSSIFLATSTGLNELVVNPLKNGANKYVVKLIKYMRCRWVDYDRQTKILIAAFKDGLAQIIGDQVIPFTFNGTEVPAVTMQLSGNKFYLSTFGEGMLSLDASGIKKINVLDDYKSLPVFHIKAFKDTVWLLGAGFIVLFDPKTDQPYHDIIIPAFPDADIYDIAWVQRQTVLLTSEGIYALRSSPPDTSYKVKNYLLKVSVNGKDTITAKNLVLPHDKNSLTFFLAIPYYTNADKTYFKYRLVGSEDESWNFSDNGENVFRYASLRPGKYQFEAIAIHSEFGTAETPIVFPFRIRPAWYQTILLWILLSLVVAGVIILIVIMFFTARIKQQKITYGKQLAVHNERDRISAEIHDDIGAGLSGVRLLTELTGNKTVNPETREDIDKIYSSISELSSKIHEVIWSLNTQNDTLEHLLRYIQRQAKQLLEPGGIKLLVNLPGAVPPLEMGSEIRTDIYLSVKEALHNALKHSGARQIELNFHIDNDKLYISVSDDGNGM